MTVNEFAARFAEELDGTPVEQFTPATEFKALEAWGSLAALSIISMVDEEFEKTITGADLRSVATLEELYNLIQSK